MPARAYRFESDQSHHNRVYWSRHPLTCPTETPGNRKVVLADAARKGREQYIPLWKVFNAAFSGVDTTPVCETGENGS